MELTSSVCTADMKRPEILYWYE